MYKLTFEKNAKYEDYAFLGAFIDGSRRNELETRKSDISALCSLLAELLVRRHVISECGKNNAEIEIIRSSKGKPRLKNCDGLHFSISHTDTDIFVEFSEMPIGIDAERIKNVREKIAARWFTPNEQKALGESAEPDVLFTEIWTRKEAYSKLTGAGFACGFDRIETMSGEFDAVCETNRSGDIVISSAGNNLPAFEIDEITVDELIQFFRK